MLIETLSVFYEPDRREDVHYWKSSARFEFPYQIRLFSTLEVAGNLEADADWKGHSKSRTFDDHRVGKLGEIDAG